MPLISAVSPCGTTIGPCMHTTTIVIIIIRFLPEAAASDGGKRSYGARFGRAMPCGACALSLGKRTLDERADLI